MTTFRFKGLYNKFKGYIETGVTAAFMYTALDFVGNRFAFATICSGPSMEPTINKSGDGVLVHVTDEFNVGDIVVAKCPTDPKKRKSHFDHLCCSYFIFARDLQENTSY